MECPISGFMKIMHLKTKQKSNNGFIQFHFMIVINSPWNFPAHICIMKKKELRKYEIKCCTLLMWKIDLITFYSAHQKNKSITAKRKFHKNAVDSSNFALYVVISVWFVQMMLLDRKLLQIPLASIESSKYIHFTHYLILQIRALNSAFTFFLGLKVDQFTSIFKQLCCISGKNKWLMDGKKSKL